MKILIIEDEPAALKPAHPALSDAGHPVSGARADGQAFEKIQADAPDVIRRDMNLPGVHGVTLAWHLRARHAPGETDKRARPVQNS